MFVRPSKYLKFSLHLHQTFPRHSRSLSLFPHLLSGVHRSALLTHQPPNRLQQRLKPEDRGLSSMLQTGWWRKVKINPDFNPEGLESCTGSSGSVTLRWSLGNVVRMRWKGVRLSFHTFPLRTRHETPELHPWGGGTAAKPGNPFIQLRKKTSKKWGCQ